MSRNALEQLLNQTAPPPQMEMVPFEQVAGQYSPEELEHLYPGITAPGGHLQYVKTSPTGQMMINPPVQPMQVHIRPPPTTSRAKATKSGVQTDALAELLKMMQSGAASSNPNPMNLSGLPEKIQ